MGHAHVRAGLAHDGLYVPALLLLLEDDLHPHGVPPESQGLVQVGDG